MPEPEAQYGDDGELEGYVWEQPDGNVASYDPDGYLVGLATDQGWLDADQLEYADEAGDDPQSALDQRLAELEQRVSEPRAVEYYAGTPEIDRDAMANDVQANKDRLERLLDRPLLASEWRRMVGSMSEAEVAGQAVPDIEGAAIRLAQEGRGVLDLDGGSDHQQRAARQEYQRQRLEEIERSENPADDLVSDIAPPSQEAFDLDDRTQRAAYITDRLRGADVSETDTFSSSSFENAERWEEDQ